VAKDKDKNKKPRRVRVLAAGKKVSTMSEDAYKKSLKNTEKDSTGTGAPKNS